MAKTNGDSSLERVWKVLKKIVTNLNYQTNTDFSQKLIGNPSKLVHFSGDFAQKKLGTWSVSNREERVVRVNMEVRAEWTESSQYSTVIIWREINGYF